MAVAKSETPAAAYRIPTGNLKGRRRPSETIIQSLLFLSGAFSILVTIGIVYELGKEALLFFQMPNVHLLDTITSTRWQPHTGEFGIWGLVTATFMTSFIAMLVAAPLGLAVAIYLSEYASEKARRILKPILEVLAGVPTIVYGYFALSFMTPLLRAIFGKDTVQIYNTGSAGLVMGILILPLDCLDDRRRLERRAPFLERGRLRNGRHETRGRRCKWLCRRRFPESRLR